MHMISMGIEITIFEIQGGPRFMYAQKPRCPEAKMPRSPDAQKPKYPEAQMPRSPDTQMPKISKIHEIDITKSNFTSKISNFWQHIAKRN